MNPIFLNSPSGQIHMKPMDEISWLDWSFLEKNWDHFSYTKHMIAFRKAHDVIRKPSGVCSLGLPNIKVIPPVCWWCSIPAGTGRIRQTIWSVWQ